MYKTQGEARAFFDAFKPLVASSAHCDIVLAPPFTSLTTAVEAAKGAPISIFAQDLHWEKEGAFTGEMSARMLLDAGCKGTLVGHSERRHVFGESDAAVAKKVRAALEADLTPILCVGEKLDEREANQTEQVLERQFSSAVASLTTQQFSRIIVAYEPVWAIGTGRTATPEIAAAAHRHLRQLAGGRFTPERATALRILYGGSVKPDNIKGLMAQVEIDGVLVGGASLDAQSFASIVNF